ncbi:MAG TPA: hypothetical protein VKA90_03775 [Beijerinckiaceae bacterium]|nr:hypothetical protein [Beijerinckiaceae bacterium]
MASAEEPAALRVQPGQQQPVGAARREREAARPAQAVALRPAVAAGWVRSEQLAAPRAGPALSQGLYRRPVVLACRGRPAAPER